MRVVLLACLLLAGCGDQFRYPCQDPANWAKKECQPPACSADGTCTKDLVDSELLKGIKK